MAAERDALLRKIPAVDALLDDELTQSADGLPRTVLVRAVREAVDEMRERILVGDAGGLTEDGIRPAVVAAAREKARAAMRPHYCRAINATGIVLHTGLGRAVLARAALDQIANELSGYSVLQLGIDTGKRSQRDKRIEWLLRQLTGCEAATVVNNNAAATLLVLNTVAAGREVIVSRGQLVEIGGSYRLPEVMQAAGVTLVEVGTTNKTHARDYERAINERTAAILRVHPSNYKIMGFSAEVALADMIAIAHGHGLPLIDDVGAGALTDFAQFGFTGQERLQDSVRAGSDLITSSADKLIGSSQGGIILGKERWIAAVRKNPLARAVRVGKLTFAALEATLTLFLDEETALREVPTLRMLQRTADDLAAQAKRIADAIKKKASGAHAELIDGFSQMGSGSLPTENIPTTLVAVTHPELSADEIASRLRHGSPPVFARIQHDRVLLDPRTLQDGDEAPLVEALASVLARVKA
jgi:L-seryl-tRNA(Ser) seleniumtransferase